MQKNVATPRSSFKTVAYIQVGVRQKVSYPRDWDGQDTDKRSHVWIDKVKEQEWVSTVSKQLIQASQLEVIEDKIHFFILHIIYGCLFLLSCEKSWCIPGTFCNIITGFKNIFITVPKICQVGSWKEKNIFKSEQFLNNPAGALIMIATLFMWWNSQRQLLSPSTDRCSPTLLIYVACISSNEVLPLWGSQHLTPLLHPIMLQVNYDQPAKTAGAGLLFLHFITKMALNFRSFASNTWPLLDINF